MRKLVLFLCLLGMTAAAAACGGGGPDATGAACADGEDCTGEVCLGTLEGQDFFADITFPEGYCSADCYDFTGCEDGESCLLHVPSSRYYCFQECTPAGEDCRADEGYFCGFVGYSSSGAATYVCLPPTSAGKASDADLSAVQLRAAAY